MEFTETFRGRAGVRSNAHYKKPVQEQRGEEVQAAGGAGGGTAARDSKEGKATRQRSHEAEPRGSREAPRTNRARSGQREPRAQAEGRAGLSGFLPGG